MRCFLYMTVRWLKKDGVNAEEQEDPSLWLTSPLYLERDVINSRMKAAQYVLCESNHRIYEHLILWDYQDKTVLLPSLLPALTIVTHVSILLGDSNTLGLVLSPKAGGIKRITTFKLARSFDQCENHGVKRSWHQLLQLYAKWKATLGGQIYRPPLTTYQEEG